MSSAWETHTHTHTRNFVKTDSRLEVSLGAFDGQEAGSFNCNILIYLLFIDVSRVCFQVSFFLFIVFVVYTMLPFSMRGAIIASAITCSSHTVTLSVFLAAKVPELEPLVWQVRARTVDSLRTPPPHADVIDSLHNILLYSRYRQRDSASHSDFPF